MLRRSTNYILISFVIDFLCIQAAIPLAGWLRVNLPFGKEIFTEPGIPVLMIEAGILYPLVFLLLSIYDPDRSFRVIDEYQVLSIASFISALALAGLVYFTYRDISRLYLLYFYVLHFLFIIIWRDWARLVRARQNGKGREVRRVLLIGGGEAAKRAIERLEQVTWAGLSLTGFITDGQLLSNPNAPPRLGGLQDAERVIQENKIDDVLIALPAEEHRQVQSLVSRLSDKSCNVWLIPDYFSLLIYGAKFEDLGGMSLISLKAPALSGYQRLLKRAFDVLFGSLLLLAALPLMAVIAVVIKLGSPGPVIFKQIRTGENGRLFEVYKFRTMTIDAEVRFSEVVRTDDAGNFVHKDPDDPRVTRAGRFLRRASLDELPQLINVLQGEMSLVGPRPELPVLVEQYHDWQRQRFAVPPGITGWWQVNGRSERMMHLHTEDDLYYIQHYSLLLDIQILLRTVWVVLRGRGAY